MKKTTAFMVALVLSTMMLLGEAINTSTRAADLCCDALSGCGGTDCCVGPGTASYCHMQCSNGALVICKGDVGAD